MKTETAKPTLLLLLLRGPLIIAGILAVILYPFFKNVSIGTWIQISLLFAGVGITVFDGFSLATEQFRIFLQRKMQSVVLDDILRTIFDKNGYIATITTTFVGNAAMYSFANHEQRSRLVGACFETNESEAHTILHAPGGIMHLFPNSLRHWVNDEVDTSKSEESSTDQKGEQLKRERPIVTTVNSWDEASESSSSDSSCSSAIEQSQVFQKDTRKKEVSRTPDPPVGLRAAAPSGGDNINTLSVPPSFDDVITCIMKEVASDSFKAVFKSIPERSIKIIGVVASVALATHMRCSPRGRRLVSGVVEGTAAFGLAGVALAAAGTFFAKRSILNTGARIGVPPQRILHSGVQRLWIKLRRLKQEGGLRKWQGVAAMLIMFYISRIRRNQQLLATGHSSFRSQF